jgi:two-component system, cell cycle sensor histidine kinase and response regulator CckA
MIDNEITMDLSAVAAAMQPRLREMIGSNIALQLNLERERLWVKADAGQIEQVVVILISNARDAMPEGGTITVETSRVNVGPDFIRRKVSESTDFKSLQLDMNSAPSEGNYARLLVRDTGIGMDATAKKYIFDPFFTTKDAGKGKGLGLSTMYSIINQSGGWLSVESELGMGTCFEVYLPGVGDGMRPA